MFEAIRQERRSLAIPGTGKVRVSVVSIGVEFDARTRSYKTVEKVISTWCAWADGTLGAQIHARGWTGVAILPKLAKQLGVTVEDAGALVASTIADDGVRWDDFLIGGARTFKKVYRVTVVKDGLAHFVRFV